MTTPKVPEAAIDAAAEGMADDWNPQRDPVLTAMFRDYAMSALEAAAPHLRAAWAEEVRAIEVPEHNQHDQLPSDHWYAGQKIMRDEIATLLEGGGECCEHPKCPGGSLCCCQ